MWPHREGLLSRGRYQHAQLLPPDAQKKTEPITHARVLYLLQQALTEEEYTTLSLAYTRGLVSDELQHV